MFEWPWVVASFAVGVSIWSLPFFMSWRRMSALRPTADERRVLNYIFVRGKCTPHLMATGLDSHRENKAIAGLYAESLLERSEDKQGNVRVWVSESGMLTLGGRDV